MSLYATESSGLRYDDEAEPVSGEIPGWWPWAWMVVACALLATSVGVRSWQDQRFSSEQQQQAIAQMFPLEKIPLQLGRWQLKEGGDQALDPKIARIAGSSDSLSRVYVNKDTGVAVHVLLLYGGAERVSLHTPEVCYPAVGYEQVDEVIEHPLRIGDRPANFRSVVYMRKGNSADRQEVLYGFRQAGLWSPQVEGNWKQLSKDPSLFKLQIQRRVADRERRHLNNPTEQFLAIFLQDLEQRIAEATGTAPPASAVTRKE
jgi:hypothetical protein